MRITSDMIREQRFKVRFSGYDKDEVEGFLVGLADEIESISAENATLKEQFEEMKSRQGELEELFLSAKRFSDERIEGARDEARKIIAEAELRVKEIQSGAKSRIADAEKRAHELVENATRKAQELQEKTLKKSSDTLSSLESSKSGLERDIIELKTKKNALFSELKAVLESQMSWLNEMRDVDKNQG